MLPSINSHIERMEIILTVIAVILLIAFLICIGCCLTICVSIGLAYVEKKNDDVIMRRNIQQIRSQNPSNRDYSDKVFIVAKNNDRNGSKSLMLSNDEIERLKTRYSSPECEYDDV